ncbi:MAG: hypothetical protein AAF557_07370 [Pseudomonadota bacterium]
MKITKISAYRTGLPYVGGTYAWGRGNAIDVAHTSVVVVETDAGLTGCGEFCPCGENYMVANSEGVAAMARLLARPCWAKTRARLPGSNGSWTT